MQTAAAGARATRLFARLQTGELQVYVIYALIGLALVLGLGAVSWLNPQRSLRSSLLPWLAAIVAPLLGRASHAAASSRWLRCCTVLWLTALAVHRVRRRSRAAQSGVDVPWMPSLGISLRFAVDGYNIYFVLLTALLFPAVLACAWQTGEGRSPLYLGLAAGAAGRRCSAPSWRRTCWCSSCCGKPC